MPLPRLQPLRLRQVPEPFDDPRFVFELKYDGFRALVYLEGGQVELVSRNGKRFSHFDQLRLDLGAALRAREAIVDGEVACLDEKGRPVFDALMRRRQAPCFVAFDLLWLDGEDLRALPLLERKRRLRKVIPRRSTVVLFLAHVVGRGRELFRLASDEDLEGIIAKPKDSQYREPTPWRKIKNARYSQAVGRFEKFNRKTAPLDSARNHSR